MAGSRTLLLLFGITISSSAVIKNGIQNEDEHIYPGKILTMDPSMTVDQIPALQRMAITASEYPSFIPPFVQQGTNLFYKPQFMIPGMTIPSPVTTVIEYKEDLEKDKIVLQPAQHGLPMPVIPVPFEEIPLHEEVIIPTSEHIVADPIEVSKPIVIPQPPSLPPLPELPTPIEVEVIPQYLQEVPTLPEFKPIAIPEAPVLPPFAMPDLPPINVPTIQEVLVNIEIPTKEHQPIVIPEAPVLSPFIIPELPSTVPETSESDNVIEHNSIVISETLPLFTMPELPALVMPAVPERPTFVEVQHVPEFKPIQIPEAPILPPLTMPQLLSTVPVISECDEVNSNSIVIPEAPVLSTFTMPERPTVVISATPEGTPFVEVQQILEFKPIKIPEAPVLPSFTIPEMPSAVITECDDVIEHNSIVIPEAPVLPAVVIPAAPETPSFVESLYSLESEPLLISEAPVLLPLEKNKLPSVIVPINPEWNEVIKNNSIIIPEAPVLPLFTMPELPSVIIPATPEFKPVEIAAPLHLPPLEMPVISEVNPETPEIPETIENKFSIPETPQLSPIVMPEVPTFTPLEASEVISQEIVPASGFPMIDVRVPDIKAIEIPQAPVLPPLSMAVVPEHVTVESSNEPSLEEKVSIEHFLPNLRIPELNIISSQGHPQFTLPTFWAQNIIIERVLPNIILDSNKIHPVIPKGYFLPAQF